MRPIDHLPDECCGNITCGCCLGLLTIQNHEDVALGYEVTFLTRCILAYQGSFTGSALLVRERSKTERCGRIKCNTETVINAVLRVSTVLQKLGSVLGT